jgi:F420-dependent methylenetetrahydromethanopterin dehydrogenase
MTEQTEFITVFRSGDPTAEVDATAARECLTQAGMQAILLGDDAPGVIEGTWEVRVPMPDRARAEAILEARTCQPEDESEVPKEGLSHNLDFVTLFSSPANGAESEAILIQSILESNGIPCVMISGSQYPSLGFEVRVPKSRLEEAVALVEEARQSGAAVDGEGA